MHGQGRRTNGPQHQFSNSADCQGARDDLRNESARFPSLWVVVRHQCDCPYPGANGVGSLNRWEARLLGRKLGDSLQSVHSRRGNKRSPEECSTNAYSPPEGVRVPRLAQNPEHITMRLQPPSHCEIIFDRHVFNYMLHELQRYPESEEGGKYVGYIDFGEHNRSKDHHYRVIITDFLPGGPN